MAIDETSKYDDRVIVDPIQRDHVNIDGGVRHPDQIIDVTPPDPGTDEESSRAGDASQGQSSYSSSYPPGWSDEDIALYLYWKDRIDELNALYSYWTQFNGGPFPQEEMAIRASQLLQQYRQWYEQQLLNPDPASSPEQNLANLADYLADYLAGNIDTVLTSGQSYISILTHVRNMLSAYLNSAGLGTAASQTLIEKIADVANGYLGQLFTQALNYQSWYLQQEYNSPSNQLARLSAAGLNSSFIFGSYNNTAGQSAQVAQPSHVQPSGAGAVQAQEDASKRGLIGQIFSAGASAVPALISGGASAILSVAQAAAIKQLTPLQAAEAGSNVVNNAATFEYLRSQNASLRQAMDFASISKQQEIGSNLLDQAQKNVDTSRQAYLDYFNNHHSEHIETFWETTVVDNQGNKRSYRLTNDQMQKVLRDGGRVSDTEFVEGSKSWNLSGEVHYDASGKVIFPPAVVQGKAGASFGGNYGRSSKEGSSSQQDQYNETSRSSGSSVIGYSEDGSSFRIGNSVFTSVQDTVKLPLPEHEAKIHELQQSYLQMLQEYNTLSTGQRARMLRLLDQANQDVASYLKNFTYSRFKFSLDQLNLPTVLTAD